MGVFITPLLLALLIAFSSLCSAGESEQEIRSIQILDDRNSTVLERYLSALKQIPPINISMDENCLDDEAFRRLTEARMRLYIMDIQTGHLKDKPILKTLSGFSDAIKSVVSMDYYPFYPLTDELVHYYNKIVAVDGWKEKFDTLAIATNKPYGLDQGKVFHRVGFPTPANMCYLKDTTMKFDIGRLSEGIQMGSEYFDSDSNMDAWLYSFWLRRYSEGNMEQVHSALLIANKFSNATFFDQHKRATATSKGQQNMVADDALISLYASFLVGDMSWKKTGTNKWVWNELRIPLPYTYNTNRSYVNTKDVKVKSLYFLSSEASCKANLRKIELMPDSNGFDVTYINYLINGGAGCEGELFFASINPITEMSKRVYKQVKMTDEEKEALIHSGYKASKEFDRVRTFEKGGEKIFVAPSFILGRNEDGDFYDRWRQNGFNRTSVNQRYYLADLDNDGRIEVLLDEASGLDGDVVVSEVYADQKDLLLKIKYSSEGEGQPTYYRDYSIRLLSSSVKKSDQ